MSGPLTTITYTGRRTGRTISTPVLYQRSGDEVLIGVRDPDGKTWWRNFLGEGGPITLHLDGADHAGHATAHRDDQGQVSVTVQLNS